MEIESIRKIFMIQRTVSDVFVNGEWFCFNVEDTSREPAKDYVGNWRSEDVHKWKITGVTCIPSGRYMVTLDDSPTFGKETITLTDPLLSQYGHGTVPGFRGIRVHAGNNERDTEGCQILGYKLTSDCTIAFGTTRQAVADLKARIRVALARGEQVWWTITNKFPQGCS